MSTLLLVELSDAHYAIYGGCRNQLLQGYAFDVTCRFGPPLRADSIYEIFSLN